MEPDHPAAAQPSRLIDLLPCSHFCFCIPSRSSHFSTTEIVLISVIFDSFAFLRAPAAAAVCISVVRTANLRLDPADNR